MRPATVASSGNYAKFTLYVYDCQPPSATVGCKVGGNGFFRGFCRHPSEGRQKRGVPAACHRSRSRGDRHSDRGRGHVLLEWRTLIAPGCSARRHYATVLASELWRRRAGVYPDRSRRGASVDSRIAGDPGQPAAARRWPGAQHHRSEGRAAAWCHCRQPARRTSRFDEPPTQGEPSGQAGSITGGLCARSAEHRAVPAHRVDSCRVPPG